MPARVLVAEDDEGVRSFLGTALQRAGFEVEFAADGNETLAALNDGNYGAIILDLMMPGASGFEVLAWLHKFKRSTARSRVIVLTAMAERDLKNLTPDRVFAVIRKPFDLSEMLATVTRCVAS
jgi:DNA-binding response OmpR family regulator